jgi:hypothetical protein
MRLAPRFLMALLSAATASLAVTATASAATLDLAGTVAQVGQLAGLGTCGNQVSSAAFRPWGDPLQYVLAPSGDFTTPDSWELHSAKIVTSASPKSGGRALALADGGSAISPVTCLSLLHPTLRLFARNTGASGSRLRVIVLFGGSSGRANQLQVATLQAGSAWSPTPIIPVLANLFSVLSPGGYAPVSFRFEEVGSQAGQWQIDDVYVDPFKGH